MINIPLDYPTIQEGIDNSANSDTVLVAPGLYVENIVFSGHEIVLASHHFLTPQQELIDSTIIDGSMSARVVRIIHGEGEGTELHGFTIQNGVGGIKLDGGANPALRHLVIRDNEIAGAGSGIYVDNNCDCLIENVEIFNNRNTFYTSGGGGIYMQYSDVTIRNAHIHDNSSANGRGGGLSMAFVNLILEDAHIHHNNARQYGGGIYAQNASQVILHNVVIHDNRGRLGGGGIAIFNTSVLLTDNQNPTSVYDNWSSLGRDFYSDPPQTVILDTASVINPSPYHAWPLSHFTFNIQVGKHAQYTADRYVSPDGDDSNSGNSWADPLQSIDRALCTLIPGTATPRVIHLAPGIYSTESNGELFPLGWISGISLYGAGNNESILDAAAIDRVVVAQNMNNASLRHLTLTGGSSSSGGGIYVDEAAIELQSVLITGNTATTSGGGMRIYLGSADLVSCLVINNVGGGIYNQLESQLSINNCILWGNEEYQIHTANTNAQALIDYSDIQGGPEYIYGFQNHVTWGAGNINADPLFCATDSLYTLVAENSPCLGSGYQGQNMGAVQSGCAALPAYAGPVWYVANTGSDELGDGSEYIPWATIPQAIYTASSGDTILVEMGIYTDVLDFMGKNLVMTSRIIDAFSEDIISATILDGSNIPGESLINLDGSYSSETVVQGFVLQNCTGQDSDQGCSPGAIYIGNNAQPQLRNLIIRDNSSECELGSGAILIRDQANPSMDHVLFYSNSAAEGAAALSIINSAELQLTHVTMNQNSATAPAIYAGDQAQITVINSIIQDDWVLMESAEFTATYSNFPNAVPGTGNLPLDPDFLDPQDFDFHLNPTSPCIDMGSPFGPDDPDGTVADMGVYYFNQDYEVWLEFGQLDVETWELPIYMINEQTVAGFQIEFSGLIISGAYGGSAQANGFMISANDNMILGFAMGVIPPGEGILTNLILEEVTGDPICFEFNIVSGTGGQQLYTVTGPCIGGPVCELPGDLNEDGILDVLDIIHLVNCILDLLDCHCGDLNGNGVLNIQDILLLVNLIMAED